MRTSIVRAVAPLVLGAALAAGCGGGGDDAGGATTSAPAPAAGGLLTTDTACGDWLAASPDAKAQALRSAAAYDAGGINAWIAETRRTLAASSAEAATVPDTVPVADGVALVDRACAAVLPDDTVASAIPAITYHDREGATTAP